MMPRHQQRGRFAAFGLDDDFHGYAEPDILWRFCSHDRRGQRDVAGELGLEQRLSHPRRSVSGSATWPPSTGAAYSASMISAPL